ncbi:Diacylglycerol kinase delta, partial [Clarias magur]
MFHLSLSLSLSQGEAGNHRQVPATLLDYNDKSASFSRHSFTAAGSCRKLILALRDNREQAPQQQERPRASRREHFTAAERIGSVHYARSFRLRHGNSLQLKLK